MQLVDVVVVLVSLALLMGASDATAVQATLRAQLEMGLGKPTRAPTVPRPRSAPTVPAPTATDSAVITHTQHCER
jgi:hypothetical protein